MGAVEIVIYVIITLCILGYINFRINMTEALAEKTLHKFFMDTYLSKFNQKAISMIFLDYASASYGVIDTLLSNERDNFIVILRGPEWLFTLKKRMWEQHEIINWDEVPFLTDRAGVISRTRKGEIQYFKNQREFLEYHRAKSEFIARLEKKFEKA